MAKQIREKSLISDDWFFGQSVTKIMETLREYSEKYGSDAVITSETWGYDGPDEYYINYDRDETEEERTKRLAKSKQQREYRARVKAETEAQERKELERLKQKYE